HNYCRLFACLEPARFVPRTRTNRPQRCASDPDWQWRACPQPTRTTPQPFTLDDHSKVVPRLPIPNRTVKRLCADDSGRTSVKVGHRQALTPQNPICKHADGVLSLGNHHALLSLSSRLCRCISLNTSPRVS